MNYAVEQRMRFIEFIVDNFEFVRPAHVSEYFGLASAQATRDISMYSRLAPNNIFYLPSEKKWVKKNNFDLSYK